MIRSVMRRLLLRAGRVPRHLPIGGHDPQDAVQVTLEGPDLSLDVTHNHVVAALRPLSILMALPKPLHRDLLYTLSFASREGASVLGWLRVAPTDSLEVQGSRFQLFQWRGHEFTCMSRTALLGFRAYNGWFEWRRRKRRNFRMESRELEAHQVLYLCPRPVVLVTVRHERSSNLFPMDLIGPTASPFFVLALRSTSPSIPLMIASRRLALADVPLERARDAYRLGEHHEKAQIEWDTLPFPLDRSPQFALPVMRDALRVRELEIEHTHVVGSHTLFFTRIVHEQVRHEARGGRLQMVHVSGPYYRFLMLSGRPTFAA